MAPGAPQHDPYEILSVLADPRRLGVLASLVRDGDATTAQLASRTGLAERDTLRAVGALRAVALVDVREDGAWRGRLGALARTSDGSSYTTPPRIGWIDATG